MTQSWPSARYLVTADSACCLCTSVGMCVGFLLLFFFVCLFVCLIVCLLFLGGRGACFCSFVVVVAFLTYRLVGLVVRRLPRERRPRVRIPLAPGFFRGRVIPVTEKLVHQWLPFQAPGVIGSALGLVGPVSVYCDWVR